MLEFKISLGYKVKPSLGRKCGRREGRRGVKKGKAWREAQS